MKIESQLLTVLECLYEPVIVISKDSTVVYINKAYTKQFKARPEKLIGIKIRELEPNGRMLEVLETGKPLINDYSYLPSLKMHVHANMTPLIENGEVIGVVTVMKDIREIKKLQQELKNYKEYSSQLEEQLNRQNNSLLDSQVPAMKKIVNLAYKVAPTDATVLLRGESGVGKEVFANTIHQASNRRNKPFIPINMPSIPDSLFESELFGYEEGSFTGSRKGGKVGLFEMADGGTVFLDEIGDMSLNTQAKILRVIQELSYRKVGGTKLMPLNVRLICATNRNLKEMVREGKFREDLYYRLNVVPIHIPALRERKDDIPYLVQQILHRLSAKYGKYVTVDEEVYTVFKSYEWPGNVRELVNVLERMIVICSEASLSIEEVPNFILQKITKLNTGESANEHVYNSLTNQVPLQQILDETEKNIIEKVLESSKNRTEAIQKLGISRKRFYSRLKKYGLHQ